MPTPSSACAQSPTSPPPSPAAAEWRKLRARSIPTSKGTARRASVAPSRVWQLVDLDGRCDVGVVGMVVDDVVTNLVVVDEAQLAVGAGMRSFVHASMIDTV